MNMECPHCGASAVGWEGLSSQGDDATQKVCRDCGAILEEGSFQNDHATAGGYQEIPIHTNYAPSGTESMTLPQGYLDNLHSVVKTVHISKGHRLGKQKIKHLLKSIGVEGKHLFQEALDMYNEVLKTNYFKQQELHKKELIAGACVMITCRKQDMPITVNMMCMMLNCSDMAFNTEFFKLQKHLGFKLQALDIDNFIDQLCRGQSPECIQCTKQVISVARKTWISEGRHRDGIIMAANFFAWQSLDAYNRCKVSLRTYAKEQGWKMSSRLIGRHKDIGIILCSLASMIPWLTKSEITTKNIAMHLKDIIQYQKSLFQQIQLDSDVDDEKVTSDEKNNQPLGDSTKIVSAESIQQPDTLSVTAKKMPAQSSTTHLPINRKQSYSQRFNMDVDGNSGKKNKSSSFPTAVEDAILKPPISITNNNKKSDICDTILAIPYHPNLDSVTIGEEDIPECEMSDYIKQENEIADHNLIRLKVQP